MLAPHSLHKLRVLLWDGPSTPAGATQWRDAAAATSPSRPPFGRLMLRGFRTEALGDEPRLEIREGRLYHRGFGGDEDVVARVRELDLRRAPHTAGSAGERARGRGTRRAAVPSRGAVARGPPTACAWTPAARRTSVRDGPIACAWTIVESPSRMSSPLEVRTMNGLRVMATPAAESLRRRACTLLMPWQ